MNRLAVALRPSFGVKLLLAMLGTIVVVLALMLVAVRRETAREVGRVADRALLEARHAFHEVEQLQRMQLERLGEAFTESPRTMAALEAARDGADVHWLAETARYELALRMTPHYLAAFTDPDGRPLLTMLDGTLLDGDPATLGPLVKHLMDDGAPEERAYRIVGGRLYLLQVQPVGLAGAPVGTVAFGLPTDDEAAASIGQVLGAEVCFIAGGRCLAGTPGARGALLPVLAAGAHSRPTGITSWGGHRWQVIADTVSTARAGETWRVMAVPMDPVLEPFDHIRRALFLAGGVALVLALLLGAGLARNLTRPVRELSEATVRVARGDYTAHVRVRSRDELGALAGSFNDMAAGLLLKERYRGILDKVVSPEVAADLVAGEIRLGGENREVTTVFADVVSFSAMVEGMEPQQVIALLNECMERLDACVHAEGGIVDKYVGDAIMAVFGAPIAHPDDALRATRAAIRMQSAMIALNHEREARGEPRIHLAIGVNRGVAVAGNMGSPSRLNYTVLGDSVNLASRLCSAAEAGEILLSEQTYEQVRDQLPGRSLGPRLFKGFSAPIRVYAVDAFDLEATSDVAVPVRGTAAPLAIVPPSASTSGGATPAVPAPIRLLLFGLAFAAAAAGPAGAQEAGGLPTLAGLGIGYTSPSGSLQVTLSGRLDVDGFLPRNGPVGLIPADDAFAAGRIRLVSELIAGPRVYSLVELRADRGEAPSAGAAQARVEQAFVRVRPLARARFQVQAGKFALPFGGYAPRHDTDADPFIRPPLPYDYRTVVAARAAPASLNGFLGWQDVAAFRARGAPPVWSVPYPWGAMLLGNVGPLTLHVAAMANAPSSAPGTWTPGGDRLRHPSIVAGASLALTPELGIGASFDRGPFMESLTDGALPLYASTTDFHQQLWGVDAHWLRGRVALRAEALLDRWQVPNLDQDPRDLSGYLEASVKTLPGLFVAGRLGGILFDRLDTPAGTRAWDHDAGRVEVGAGYRIVRNAEIRAQYLGTRTRSAGAETLWAVQWWWTF